MKLKGLHKQRERDYTSEINTKYRITRAGKRSNALIRIRMLKACKQCAAP